MRIITGRICKLLHGSIGDVHGFSLDTGLDVHFPPDQAARVTAAVTTGSLVEIQACVQGSFAGDSYVNAAFLTNLDSGESIDLHARPTPHSPEVSHDNCAPPREKTPLAPAFRNFSEQPLSERAVLPPSTSYSDVVREIEQAYDRLHRVQAMLAYLRMLKQETSVIGQYLDEAKHTYVQALSRYQARDFEGAREFAAASCGLCRLVEIIISITFHSSANYPRLVPLPPEHVSLCGDREEAEQELHRVERLLTRVRWVTENGTLPSEDRAQVEKLSCWTESLCRWARRLLETGAKEDGIGFTRAADAAVCSAEHLCRKCYVTRTGDLQPAAASQ